VAPAIALLVLIPAGVVMAVPASRDAVLDWFGVGSVEIRRVEILPRVPDLDLVLPPRVTLDSARREADFPVLVPAALGEPDTVHLATARGRDPEVTLVYRPRPGLPAAPQTGVGLLISQQRGMTDPGLLRKLVAEGTVVRGQRVGDRPAVSLEGGPHVVIALGPDGEVQFQDLRLAANTLLFERDGVLVRLEGAVPAAELVRIAETLR
jgi:hypothetical protein